MRYFFLLSILFLTLAGCIMYHPVNVRNPMLFPVMWYEDGYAKRISSWDRTGANNDNIQIYPGETVTLADIQGAGIIRHIWITTNSEENEARTLVLRMYWDGSDTPAVEVPLGDFFGVGNGMRANVYSWPITVVSRGRARNCWWQMPFAKAARITITNEGTETQSAFYYHIDYLALPKPPATRERFYAQYRQAYPADSSDNYVILETTGSGHYMGVVMSVEATKPQWWGEGDELIIVDDCEPIRGTGTEDYFCDAWGIRESATLWHGCPVSEGFREAGLRTSMYRFHILDPIPFRRRISVSIEHGSGNNRADNLSSVAFWYQIPPSSPFPPLPPVEERLLGRDLSEFIRKRAWQMATSGSENAHQQIAQLLNRAKSNENIQLIKGLMAYVDGLKELTDDALAEMDNYLSHLDEMVKALPEDERYTSPVIDVPTDNDNPVPSDIVKTYRMLERARNDLARKVALKRGLRPGDEIIVEVRDSLGRLTPPPTYKETPDFTNSYAKVDDTHLMGKGARFTYGGATPSWARFTPNFPRSGRYEVFTIFSYGANAGDTRYEIRHADGVTTVPLEQRGRPGTEGRNNRVWHSLGIYRFEKGQNPEKGSVTLHASPGTKVPNSAFEYRAYADAIRFVYREE